MSKSVINTDYIRSQEIPPYELSERQLKKHRKVNYKGLVLTKNFSSIFFLLD